MGLLYAELFANGVDEGFDLGDAFHAGGNLDVSHFSHGLNQSRFWGSKVLK